MKTKIDDEKLIDGIQKILIETGNENTSREYATRLLEITNLIIEVASGEFECSKCKEKFQIYLARADKNKQ